MVQSYQGIPGELVALTSLGYQLGFIGSCLDRYTFTEEAS